MTDKRSVQRQGKSPRRQMSPKKKRRILERKVSQITLWIFGPLFIVLVLFQIFFQRSTISIQEMRTLALFPEFSWENFWSGEYAREVDYWFADTIPYRDSIKGAANTLLSFTGIHTNTPVFVAAENGEAGGLTVMDTESAEESTEAAEESAEIQTASSNGVLIINHEGNWRAIDCFSCTTVEPYIQSLNAFKAAVGDTVNVYSMVVPYAAEFYYSEEDTSSNQKQAPWLEKIENGLDDRISSIDLVSVLQNHADEDIFYRLDNRWTSLGAYYAAESFAKAAGVDFADLQSYSSHTIPNFVGNLSSLVDDERLSGVTEDFVYYTLGEGKTADYYDTRFNYTGTDALFRANQKADQAYLTYMGGDQQICKIKGNDCSNGRVLLVIKDSFGNAEVGYYSSSFEKIYVIDYRYAEVNLIKFVKEKEVTDVLFTMSMDSVSGTACMERIMGLITDYKDVELPDAAPDEQGAY